MLKKTNQFSIFYKQIVKQIEARDIFLGKITSRFNAIKSLGIYDEIITMQDLVLTLTQSAELDCQVKTPKGSVIENSRCKLNNIKKEDPP